MRPEIALSKLYTGLDHGVSHYFQVATRKGVLVVVCVT